MSTILSNTAVSTWKRIKVQHIALVCGLAIAASAAAAIGGWEADSATTPASPARASISTPLSDDTPQFVLFIAGSQQQADDHAAAIRQDLNPAWFASHSFVVVTNADEEAQVRSLRDGVAMELVAAGTNFEVVDLRSE